MCHATSLAFLLLSLVVCSFRAGLALDTDAVLNITRTLNKGVSWEAPGWQEALTSERERMKLERLWLPDSADEPDIPITLFTTLSLERLGQLQNLCESWPGPLVAAVWLPVVIPSDTEPLDESYYNRLLSEQRSTRRARRRAQRRVLRPEAQSAPTQSTATPRGNTSTQPRTSTAGSATNSTVSSGARPSEPVQATQAADSRERTEEQQLAELEALLTQLRQTRKAARVAQRHATVSSQLHQSSSVGSTARRRLTAARTQPPTEPPEHVQRRIDEAVEKIEAARQRIEEIRAGSRTFAEIRAASRTTASGPRTTPASPTQPNESDTQTTADSTAAEGGLQSSFVSHSAYMRRHRLNFTHISATHRLTPETEDTGSGALFADAAFIGRLPPCALTIMLFVQPFRDSIAPLYLYPINSLRNYAALMARTPLVSMIDVDLTVNSRFALSLIANPQRVEDLVQDAASGSLLVLPAFEAPLCNQAQCRDGVAAARVAIHSTKPQLANLISQGWIDTFHCSKGFHWIVDYKRWLQSPLAYEVRYARGAEPWLIGHKNMLPWYDTRFKGFGFNKQVQLLYALGNMRLRLKVLPDAWLIHVPHHDTHVSRAFRAKGLVSTQPAPSSDPPTHHHRTLLVNTAVNARVRLEDKLLQLYAHIFTRHLWPLGLKLCNSEPNRMPRGEHPHVDDAMRELVRTLPWWTPYTARFHDGQPSAVRPPFLDPPARPPWPVQWVKEMRAKLSLCSARKATLRNVQD